MFMPNIINTISWDSKETLQYSFSMPIYEKYFIFLS